ncbi:MAG: hypothetical protein NTY55_02385 [Flavobacteriia bacterium]|nr:hypothetical protein [Flavobacteriia bacterium]
MNEQLYKRWMTKVPLGSLPNPWDTVVPKGSTKGKLFEVSELLKKLLKFLKFKDLVLDNTTIKFGTEGQLFDVVIPTPVGLLGNVTVCLHGDSRQYVWEDFQPRIDFSQGFRSFGAWFNLINSLKEVMEIEQKHYRERMNVVATVGAAAAATATATATVGAAAATATATATATVGATVTATPTPTF